MSRAKAKLAIVHDLQSKQSDMILTKKDCDMIAAALLEKYEYSEIKQMYLFFKRLGYI